MNFNDCMTDAHARDILAIAARNYPKFDLHRAITAATRDYLIEEDASDDDINRLATFTHDFFLAIAF